MFSELFEEVVEVIEGGTSDHARKELQLAGLFDEDSDYGGMIGTAVLDLIDVFGDQGHSGFSAEMTKELFNKLASFEQLTPLTDDPDEWMDVSEYSADGPEMWQSTRNPACFSMNGGKTYYNLDDKKKKTYKSEPAKKGEEVTC